MPAAPVAAPAPASPAAAATAVAPPAGGLPQIAAGENAPAGAAAALPVALPGTGLGLEPPAELSVGAGEQATLERLPLAPRLVAAPEAARGERARAAPAGSPPVAPPGLAAPTVTAAAAAPPAVAGTGVPALGEDVVGRPAQVQAPPPASIRQSPAAAPEAALAGAELLESAPGADGAAEPTVDGAEIAPARVERAASEPPSPSPRGAPPLPPPPVQIGIQIASAASRRVERMVVQLEPAALGRVEVRLDFSHDNRVSALIAADRPETLDVLQRDSRALERSLQDAGLRLADNGLNFSLRQDQRHPQQGAATPHPALPAQPPRAPAIVADARPLQWLSAERILDIRI